MAKRNQYDYELDIQTKIAKIIGWTKLHMEPDLDPDLTHTTHLAGRPGATWTETYLHDNVFIPNYATSLDAMYEAEQYFKNDISFWAFYGYHLKEAVKNRPTKRGTCIAYTGRNVPAIFKAEAFLKAVNNLKTQKL